MDGIGGSSGLQLDTKAEQEESQTVGRRPNGFLGLSLNDRTIQFRVILLDKTVSVR